eukprot:1160368-Pelagomonas_calceolata.AAC.1
MDGRLICPSVKQPCMKTAGFKQYLGKIWQPKMVPNCSMANSQGTDEMDWAVKHFLQQIWDIAIVAHT